MGKCGSNLQKENSFPEQTPVQRPKHYHNSEHDNHLSDMNHRPRSSKKKKSQNINVNKEIYQFLQKNKLGIYYDIFIENGYSSLELLDNITKDDLKEMNVKLAHQNLIIKLIQNKDNEDHTRNRLNSRVESEHKYDDEEIIGNSNFAGSESNTIAPSVASTINTKTTNIELSSESNINIIRHPSDKANHQHLIEEESTNSSSDMDDNHIEVDVASVLMSDLGKFVKVKFNHATLNGIWKNIDPYNVGYVDKNRIEDMLIKIAVLYVAHKCRSFRGKERPQLDRDALIVQLKPVTEWIINERMAQKRNEITKSEFRKVLSEWLSEYKYSLN